MQPRRSIFGMLGEYPVGERSGVFIDELCVAGVILRENIFLAVDELWVHLKVGLDGYLAAERTLFK